MTELPTESTASPTPNLPAVTESPEISDSGTDNTSEIPEFDFPTADYSSEEIEESTDTDTSLKSESRQGKVLGTPEIFTLPVTTTSTPDYVADLTFSPSLLPGIVSETLG
jgi:hypothetical protein